MGIRDRTLSYFWGSQKSVEIKGLQRLFEERVGYPLNIESPKTYNEKVQWRKLFDRRPIFVDLVDKFRVRDYVARRVGEEYLVPLLAESESARKLDFHNVQPPYVIKTNNASGKVYFVRTGEDIDLERLEQLKRSLERQMGRSYGLHKLEWAYWAVRPRIIVERMLLDATGSIPPDYKFHCFGGYARYIEVHTGRFSQHARSYFDREWQRLDLRRVDGPAVRAGFRSFAPTADSPPPRRLEEMVQVAEALAEDLDYVRVDLYENEEQVYFGEMTLFPASGFKAFDPPEADRQWGDLWTLPLPDERVL